jgi:hypothetical protein
MLDIEDRGTAGAIITFMHASIRGISYKNRTFQPSPKENPGECCVRKKNKEEML